MSEREENNGVEQMGGEEVSTMEDARQEPAALVFRRGCYYVESNDPKTLMALLRDPVVARARVKAEGPTATPPATGELSAWHPDVDSEVDDDDDDILRFQIHEAQVDNVKRRAIDLAAPLVEEYDYATDKTTPNLLGIHLKPTTQIRRYQERALSRMLGSGCARPGIIVLPCGAGKTLTGITAAQTVRKSTLVLCPNTTLVYQWRDQFLLWTNGSEQYLRIFTADQKDGLPSKDEACILITTYQMFAFSGKHATETQLIMDMIHQRTWGLMLLDEVHVVPASKYRLAVQSIPAHCRLGLTATLVREDDLISDLRALVGPKLYEANWMDLTAQGYLATVLCVEAWCPMTERFREEYQKASSGANHNKGRRRQELLYIMNPGKLRPVEFLVRFHEEQGDKIIVFSDSIFCLRYYARLLQRPYIYGDTKEWERQAVLSTFRRPTNEVQTICLSQVGDAAIDLPRANVIIQVSSHFGARRKEAQRLGRILRPKSGTGGSTSSSASFTDAYFYTLVTPDTQEMSYNEKRQQYLSDQGYTFKVIRNLQESADTAAIKDGYVYSSRVEDEEELLQAVLSETSSGQA